MIQRILLTAALLMLIGNQAAFGEVKPDRAIKKVKKAISAEARAQKKADEWTWTKKDIMDEIRDLNTRVTWLKYMKEKHNIYIGRVRENIANLEFKKAEALKVREQLDPYLEEIVDRLAEFVGEDLPFLPDERERRLKFLKDSLNDYQIQLSEKLRRVFEALQVEATYGKMVSSIDTTLNLGGSDTQVTVLRLGRVAMFYLSLDGSQIGLWNDKTKQWEPISEQFIRPIRRLLDMAERKRSVELTEIPLGAL